MSQSTVLWAEINCNDLINEIFLLYPHDDTQELQPLAEYINDRHIDYKELEGISEDLQEHGIINIYNEFTDWSQKNKVGIVVHFDNPLAGDECLFPHYVHLISKQGKLLIEKVCPELRQLNKPGTRYLPPSTNVCYN